MNLHYIITFLISGSIVSGISYLGNLYNPIAASILSAIPISIPSMLLIASRHKQKMFIKGTVHMIFILMLCNIFCYYLISQLDYQTYYAVCISLILWIILASIYYTYI
tara:strand:- start:9575 stop:9898 length:324 start_codon:yes stop_codon:yes gene_type:complete